MLKPRKPSTSPVVIMLFWTMALVLLATVVSGLRVGATYGLTTWHGSMIPRTHALSTHLTACLMLVMTCLLFLQRVRHEAVAAAPRRRSVLMPRGVWQRADSLMAQAFFALVGLEAVGAVALAMGAGVGIARLHLAATLILIALVPVYVAVQVGLGGIDHVLRLLRPNDPVPQSVPLGRVPGRVGSWRGVDGSSRLFGLALGLAFGAAAAAALVTGTEAGLHRASLDRAVAVAWDFGRPASAR